MKAVLKIVFVFLFGLNLHADNIVEENLSCVGTEPFWGLSLNTDREGMDYNVYSAQFSLMGSENPTTYKQEELTTRMAQGHPYVFSVNSTNSELVAVIERKSDFDTKCSDGMSDLSYPYSAHVQFGNKLYSGCCQSNLLPADKN